MRFKDARNMGIAHLVRRNHKEARVARMSALGITGIRGELAYLRAKQRPMVRARREVEAILRQAADERIATERALQSSWEKAREIPDPATRADVYRSLRVPDDAIMIRRRLSNDACFWCGAPYDGDVTSLRRTREHVIPLSRGGDSSYSNVVFSHLACNNRRGSDISWVPFHEHGNLGHIVKRSIEATNGT